MKTGRRISQNRLILICLTSLLIPAGCAYFLLYSSETWRDEAAALLFLGWGSIALLYLRKKLQPWQKLVSIASDPTQGTTSTDELEVAATGLVREQHELAESLRRNHRSLKNATALIRDIEAGKLDTADILNEEVNSSSEDGIVAALLSLRKQMVEIADNEKERRWTNEGLTKFIDILRSQNREVNKLADQILSNLVKYVGANQGGLYIFDEDENRLKLIACYAFDKKKHVEQQIQPGQGLIGQTFVEKKHLLLTNVPEEYVKITSGLGEANPRCVLILPVMLNGEVFGILELASFTVFLPYQIAFLERLCESIAATVSAANVQQKTNQLLADSQQAAEEMQAQEEEIRQNMEELEATQEEMARKQIELEKIKETLEKKNKEIEEVSQRERTRADAKIKAQKNTMLKAVETYKVKEQELKAALSEKEEELSKLIQSQN
ncbi:GAF domain-containing protein [Tunicatimonas pelagia]|uniref:GAF domain-containing protein n=1 Tax=Tunicatimonas pelagia TaxID=931531 RepID=UPI0026655546|nr:GAF domain-containing protein [Tunicatimonas pelagia]WKN44068.1 GAF domain-containing protein [Tunicatimonas pelagia]